VSKVPNLQLNGFYLIFSESKFVDVVPILFYSDESILDFCRAFQIEFRFDEHVHFRCSLYTVRSSSIPHNAANPDPDSDPFEEIQAKNCKINS